MKKMIPINTTSDGCSFTIVSRYDGRAYLKSMTGGGRILPLHRGVGGVCKCIYARYGKLSWENFLGRLEHGGWDCQMTCVMEINDEETH
jgi:hypothetical protein